MAPAPDERAFEGRRLKLARDLSGVSQGELAHLVGVSTKAVTRLEKMHGAPSAALFDALAWALGVKPEFFGMPLDDASGLPVFWRKLARTRVRMRERIEARARVLLDLVKSLEEHVDLPALDVPHQNSGSVEAVERAAEACRVHWGLGIDAPIQSMVRLLERAGVPVVHFSTEGRVGESADGSGDIDALSTRTSRPLVLRNEKKQSNFRARFDLAHELGHIVLHRRSMFPEREREAEADRFASAFLLPRMAFHREFHPALGARDWLYLGEFRRRWQVSLGAIVRRAYDLGRIDPIEYRRANIEIRVRGWHRAEEGDQAAERGSLLTDALAALEDRPAAIASRVGLRVDTLEALVGPLPEEPTRGLPMATGG